MPPKTLKIQKVNHEFHPNFLDIVGKDFSSDHVKGLAEWLKNSSDAYTREDIPDAEQEIFLILESKPFRFMCLDFVGMTRDDIEKAFKQWGNPDAAARGKKDKQIWGGHGNGGKFYMRQMFREAYFITYRKGHLNIFGFNEKKEYGYSKGFENKRMGWKEAIEEAGLDKLPLPHELKQRRLKGTETAFTLVVGVAPDKMRGKNGPTYIWRRLTKHPHARRILDTKQVFAVVDDNDPFRLKTPEVPPKPGFEGPFKIPMPTELEWNGDTISLASPQFKRGELILRTAEDPFDRSAESHAIDFFGKHSCVATYPVRELGPYRFATATEFIYGECHLPILESKMAACVRNDRQRLVENDLTEAVLHWVGQQIDDLANTLENTVEEERRTKNLEQSAKFNDYLNVWQKRFMSSFWREVFGGTDGGAPDRVIVPTPPAAAANGNAPATDDGAQLDIQIGAKDDSKSQTDEPSHRSELGGAGKQPQRVPRYPQVLLSGFHPDPTKTTGETLVLQKRHPPIYQRREDQAVGVYWINTESPFAKAIRDIHGVDSVRWREYLFLRRIDVMVKLTIYEKAKQEPKLSADTVDLLIDNVQRKVFEAATGDLRSYLFEAPTKVAALDPHQTTIREADE